MGPPLPSSNRTNGFPAPAYPVISRRHSRDTSIVCFLEDETPQMGALYAWSPFGLLPSFHLGRETFFRGGIFFSKWISVPVMETHYWQRAFAPRALPRFVATMPSSDSWPDPTPVMRSRRRSRRIRPNPAVRPGFSGSRLVCQRPPSPTTPESPTDARARCFSVGDRLHHFRKAGHSRLCNEAGTGSRLRITADIAVSPGLRTAGRPAARRVDFTVNEQLP